MVVAVSLVSFFPPGRVQAQYASPSPTYPPLPPCSSGLCGTVCNNNCPDTNPNDGLAVTCTPFCNNNTGYCGFTCSTYQNTCAAGGWGDWGPCVNCWQFRVCDTNPQLGQTQCCISDSSCSATCASPTEPTSGPGPPTAPPGATNTPIIPSATPTTQPSGTIRVRAVEVSPSDTSCTAIKAVPTTDGEINGSLIRFTPSSPYNPAPSLQSGANYVQFALVPTGTYTVDVDPPSSIWSYKRACWTDVTAGTTGEGLSHALVANSTLVWDIGYTQGTAWVQAEGGDVYASASLRSFIPAVTPRVFNANTSADATGVSHGIVEYGTSYDFDSDPLSAGGTYVSTSTLATHRNWQVNNSRTTVDFYDLFYKRLGSPTTPTTSAPFDNLSSVTKPASNCTASACTPYYVSGDMTTSSAQWDVAANEKIVILVNGNVTIGGNIRITPGGFLAIIANGDIRVSSSVGRTSNGTTPNIEGVYIAANSTHDAQFETGASSTTDGTIVRLVGSGMFIADGFLLERDLQSFGVTNTGASAELFTYNPQLLLTMPDPMMDLAVTWQEVAP